MSNDVLRNIRELYASLGIEFREIEHAATRTSEESARVRGEPLHIGGKALLLKGGADYRLVVIPAHRRLDSANTKTAWGLKKLRFASSEELFDQTGLVPGSVPPFGPPILPFPLFVDESLTQNDRIAFNAGSLTVSHVLVMADYLRAAQPALGSFAVAAE